MPDTPRPHDASALTYRELERTKRELQASLALARPGSPIIAPILASLTAIDTELAARAFRVPRPSPANATDNPDRTGQGGGVVILTLAQLDRIGELGDHWSFLWDKRRSLWIAAEDCPDGEQIEEADLDALLSRLSVINAECR